MTFAVVMYAPTPRIAARPVTPRAVRTVDLRAFFRAEGGVAEVLPFELELLIFLDPECVFVCLSC
ncbi:hypothetical protein Q0Z83_105190 [Actinoplanes sichuanensis]|nr:hypothetical protein Q0Z83_105190 [Actinoplanes sichuanensis]